MEIVVIGIGQTLRGDDAAGLEIVRSWKAKYPQTAAGVRVEILETPGVELMDFLSGAGAAIIVDAVRTDRPVGTILRLGPGEVAVFTKDSRSAHGWGIAETLALGYSLEPAMVACRISFLGIVGKEFRVGHAMSPGIQKAIPEVVDRIEQEVKSLKMEVSDHSQ